MVLLLSVCAAIDAADLAMVPGMFGAFQQDLGASLGHIGTLYLLQTIIGGLALPVWGHLGDKYSRKMLIALGCLMWGIFTLGCAHVRNFQMFMLYRTAAVMFLALVSPITNSLAADLASSGERGRLFGKVGSFAATGSFIGSFLGTACAESEYFDIRGWRLCLGGVALLSVLYSLALFIFMKDPRRSIAPQNKKGTSWGSFRLWSFWMLVLQGIFGCIPWKGFGMYAPLWMELIGYTPMQEIPESQMPCSFDD